MKTSPKMTATFNAKVLSQTAFRKVAAVLVSFVFGAFVLSVLSDFFQGNPDFHMINFRFHLLSTLILFLAVPITHSVGTISYKDWRLFLKNEGVNRADVAVYQTLSWIMYAAALVASFSFVTLTLRAVLGFLAQVFMVSSLLIFESHVVSRKMQGKGSLLNNYMNMLLVVGSIVLAILSEATLITEGHGYLSLGACIGSLVLFITAILNTYGLGGQLMNSKSWKFYQPFAGGAKFMVLQFFSWICFCFSIILQTCCIMAIALEWELFCGAMLVAGALCLVSETLMVLSLRVFQHSDERSKSSTKHIESFVSRSSALVTTTVCANLPYVPVMLLILPFLVSGADMSSIITGWLQFGGCMVIFPIVVTSVKQLHYRESNRGKEGVNPYAMKYVAPISIATSIPMGLIYLHRGTNIAYVLAILCVFWYTYIAKTFTNSPEMNGRRTSLKMINGVNKHFERICDYFSGKLIKTADLDPNETYVMGFHPHGILPLTVIWLQMTQQWKTLFPGIYASPLTASAVHYLPLARDILQWMGGREVTRKAFAHALKEEQSVILVPGGQAEMIESRSGIKQLRLHTGHKGFIKIAMEHGKSLVPILSIGEYELMDNIYLPNLQRWFVKRFAFPFPHFPYGRCFLPIPRKVPITVIVGKPIPVSKFENPTMEEIDKVHTEYFQALKAMFEEHKHKAGRGDHTLVFLH